VKEIFMWILVLFSPQSQRAASLLFPQTALGRTSPSTSEGDKAMMRANRHLSREVERLTAALAEANMSNSQSNEATREIKEANQAMREANESMREANETMREANEGLSAELDTTKAELASSMAELRAKEDQVTSLTAEVNVLRDKLGSGETSKSSKKKEIKEVRNCFGDVVKMSNRICLCAPQPKK